MTGAVQDNQLKYASVLKVVANGGNVKAQGDKLVVSGADDLTFYVAAATDYRNDYPVYRTGESDAELLARVQKTADDAVARGYDAVRADHVEDFSALMNRVDLDLGFDGVVSERATDDLLTAYRNKTATAAERRQLETMLFQYGRYLTLGSSREDSQLPSNLQGVWNNVNNPQWASDYHMNVNLQMNYWPAYSTNLAECATPLLSYVDSLREPGRVTAAVYAGVETPEGDTQGQGFMAHTQNTPFGWTCPGWSFQWGWSPAAVPWILQNTYDAYRYSGDLELLKNDIYPALREEAQLYSKTLIKDENGKYISSPAYSPSRVRVRRRTPTSRCSCGSSSTMPSRPASWWARMRRCSPYGRTVSTTCARPSKSVRTARSRSGTSRTRTTRTLMATPWARAMATAISRICSACSPERSCPRTRPSGSRRRARP